MRTEDAVGGLEGKRALITGGASGIGRAAALLFARAGAAVAIADRDAVGGQTVAREIEAQGGRALFVSCDVTCAEDCARAVRQTVEALGGLEVVLNSAGITVRRSVVELDEADWDRVMDVNAKSVYLVSKYAVPVMIEAGRGGSIITVSSGWGLVGGPEAAVYCASKGAVVLLTKAMAIDFGPHNIRVNCLCPGDTDTPMLREEARQLGQVEAEFMAVAASRPLRRVGTPEEIAQAALFLASDASSYMTGATLLVDGGGLAGG
jgi:NAD(P)-dependent dehydrogenase (short-subunit alcohol dehydrogenase family)